MIAAFDGAWQSIIASGAKLSGQQSELTRELLAKYIIEQARQGELDECRLRDGAPLHLAHSNLRRAPSRRTNERIRLMGKFRALARSSWALLSPVSSHPSIVCTALATYGLPPAVT
jgi:hypothetical protein